MFGYGSDLDANHGFLTEKEQRMKEEEKEGGLLWQPRQWRRVRVRLLDSRGRPDGDATRQ